VVCFIDVELDQEVMDLQGDGSKILFSSDFTNFEILMCLDDLQSHRSVILHVLSQLRLGMDLTRVCLWAYPFHILVHMCMRSPRFTICLYAGFIANFYS